MSWSHYSLRSDWNQTKNDVAPWWAENSKETYSSGLANLATALKNWRDSKTGKRTGRKVRFPRFKGNVSGMVKNRKLARHVAGVGMAELRRQVDYKTTWRGGTLVVADRWYPSSKTCSDCGAVKAKLRLSERTFHCDQCGLVLDRDLNAARNLAGLAEAAGGTSSPSCAATLNEPDGNPRKTSTALAADTATGRPTGSTPRRKATAQDTRLHVS